MAIKQLSVFVENKKGSLHEITNILAKSGIDLRSMCVADTSDYGIVRIIASDVVEAEKLLKASGHTANVRIVNAFAVPHTPGGLANVLSLIEENGVNIEYLYALITTADNEAYTVMRTDDVVKADDILRQNNIKLLEETDI